MNDIIRTPTFDIDAHQISAPDPIVTTPYAPPMPLGGFNNHTVTHPSAASSASSFEAGTSARSDSETPPWTTQEVVPLDDDGISRTWSEAISMEHAGFNQPVAHSEDSLNILFSERGGLTYKTSENLEYNRIHIHALTSQERNSLFSALNSINRILGNGSKPPNAKRDLRVAIEQAAQNVSLQHYGSAEFSQKLEAEKIELLYAFKVINRLSADQDWVDKILKPFIQPTRSAGPYTDYGMVLTARWIPSPQETLKQLNSILSDPQIRINLSPQQRKEMQIAKDIIGFYISIHPTSRELPPLVVKLFAHYSQLRGRLKIIDNPSHDDREQYFPALSEEELQRTLSTLIDELQSPSSSGNNSDAFVHFLENLPLTGQSTSDQPVPLATTESPQSSAYFRGLSIHPEDTLRFDDPENTVVYNKAVTNITEQNINLRQMTETEKRALFHDLLFIIELTEASAAAPPISLEQALEQVKSANLLKNVLALQSNFTEETKLHLLYVLKRINRMSLDPKLIETQINTGLLGRNRESRLKAVKFLALSEWNDTHLNSLLKDHNFQIKTPEGQKQYLKKAKKLLESGALLRTYIYNHHNVELPQLLPKDDRDNIEKSVTLVLHHILNAAAQQPETDFSRGLHNAKYNATQTINELLTRLQTNTTPESQELQAALRQILTGLGA